MADVLIKNIRKKTLRTKESLRETFGKVDKTTDENFEECCTVFNEQQKMADNLQSELKNYTACLKALSQASKGLSHVVRQIYEQHWDGHANVKAELDTLDLLWDGYLQRLNDDALQPLNYYCSQFVDLKTKIAKRGRKLVDYDATRHIYNSVQSSVKKDDTKIQKTKEQMNIAKKLYEDLNNELLVSLPALYESRVESVVNHLKVIFNAEKAFHDDSAKAYEYIYNEINKMKIDSKTGTFGAATNFSTYGKNQLTLSALPNSLSNTSKENSPMFSHKSSDADESGAGDCLKKERPISDSKLYPLLTKPTDLSPDDDKNPFKEFVDDESQKKHNIINNNANSSGSEKSPKTKKRDPATIEATPLSPPEPKITTVLYKVRATHRYAAEDNDELSFEAGEIIGVINWDLTEEQDEGWLAGVKESTGQKGVFPENFTKPL